MGYYDFHINPFDLGVQWEFKIWKKWEEKVNISVLLQSYNAFKNG